MVYLLVAVVTTGPEGVPLGFPFAYNTPVSPCLTPNPFNGCGFSFHLGLALADYAIWFAVVLVVLLAARRFFTIVRSMPEQRPSVPP